MAFDTSDFIPDTSNQFDTSDFIPDKSMENDQPAIIPPMNDIINQLQNFTKGVGAGFTTLPGVKQIGAGINAISQIPQGQPVDFNQLKQNYNTGVKNVENVQNEQEQQNPIAYNSASIGANALPFFMTGGLSAGLEAPEATGLITKAATSVANAVPRMATNAAIGSGEAYSQGASPTDSAITGALTGPASEFVTPFANLVGNIARSVGDIPKGIIGPAMGFIKPEVQAVNPSDFGIQEAAGESNLQKLYTELKDLSIVHGVEGQKDVLDALSKIRNMQGANPLATAQTIYNTPVSQGGGFLNAGKFLTSNNPLNYGGLKNSVIGNTIAAGELGGTLALSPDSVGPYDLNSDLSQYGGGLASAIMAGKLNPVVKAGLINAIGTKNNN